MFAVVSPKLESAFMNQEKAVLGVDIGGSHITAALVNLDCQSIIPGTRVRQPVKAGGTAEEIISSWASCLLKAIAQTAAFSGKIAIAMPGPFDYLEGISFMKGQNKYDALYGKKVKVLLARKLNCPEKTILFRNDASSFLQGELFGGAGKGFGKALGLTLGTGLGSAYAQSGLAEDADLWRMAFKEGIAEDYLSSRWFIHRYKVLVGQEIEGVKELVPLAGKDKAVQQVFFEFGRNLSDFLREVWEKFMPEGVILGGNIAQAFPLFRSALEEQFPSTNLYLSRLGEDAALMGAASCWEKR